MITQDTKREQGTKRPLNTKKNRVEIRNNKRGFWAGADTSTHNPHLTGGCTIDSQFAEGRLPRKKPTETIEEWLKRIHLTMAHTQYALTGDLNNCQCMYGRSAVVSVCAQISATSAAVVAGGAGAGSATGGAADGAGAGSEAAVCGGAEAAGGGGAAGDAEAAGAGASTLVLNAKNTAKLAWFVYKAAQSELESEAATLDKLQSKAEDAASCDNHGVLDPATDAMLEALLAGTA